MTGLKKLKISNITLIIINADKIITKIQIMLVYTEITV